MESSCSICYDQQKEDDCYPLPCGHCFHFACISKWFETGKHFCPSCRDQRRAKLIPLKFAKTDSEVEKLTFVELESGLVDMQSKLDLIKRREPELVQELREMLNAAPDLQAKFDLIEGEKASKQQRFLELAEELEFAEGELGDFRRNMIDLTTPSELGDLEINEMHRNQVSKFVNKSDSLIVEELRKLSKISAGYMRQVASERQEVARLQKCVEGKQERLTSMVKKYDSLKSSNHKENARVTSGSNGPTIFMPSRDLTNTERTIQKMSTERKPVLCRFNSNGANNQDALMRDVVAEIPKQLKRKHEGTLDYLILQFEED